MTTGFYAFLHKSSPSLSSKEKKKELMTNTNLANAKTAKNDEFYTQYADIQKEMNAYLEYDPDVFRGKTVLLPCDDPEWSNFTRFFALNFEFLGLKKLISTSYAANSKNVSDWRPTPFEKESPYYDADKSYTNGKIFVLDKDVNGNGRFNINDLQWSYLEGDGDFRSDEVKSLRNEADIIITNPPFSLFREFFSWIMEARKQFVIIGRKNAIPLDEVFPYFKNNSVWLGSSGFSSDMVLGVPEGTAVTKSQKQKAESFGYVGDYMFSDKMCWYTNIQHGHKQFIYLEDIEIAKSLIDRNNKVERERITKSFYFEGCLGIFQSFYYNFFTDCECLKELINEVYVAVMAPNASGKRKIEDFYGESTLKTWIRTVCLHYCCKKYKRGKTGPVVAPLHPSAGENEKKDGGSDRNDSVDGSIDIDFSSMNRLDVETLLNLMPNTRYRQVIRLRHLKQWSNEDTAKELGVSMDVYYNVHKRAINQFKEVCRKEEYHG